MQDGTIWELHRENCSCICPSLTFCLHSLTFTEFWGFLTLILGIVLRKEQFPHSPTQAHSSGPWLLLFTYTFLLWSPARDRPTTWCCIFILSGNSTKHFFTGRKFLKEQFTPEIFTQIFFKHLLTIVVYQNCMTFLLWKTKADFLTMIESPFNLIIICGEGEYQWLFIVSIKRFF